MTTSTTGDPAQAARTALAAYAEDLRHGGGALAELASEDVQLTVTLPEPGRGWRSGRDELRRWSTWRHDEARMVGDVTVDGLTLGTMRHRDASTVAAFEIRFDGRLRDQPYSTHAAVVFELDSSERVAAVREYYGDNTTPASAFAPYGLEDVFAVPPGRDVVVGKPETLARADVSDLQPDAVRVGQEAFDAFATSVRDGDWQPYLGLMDAEVSFTLPIPGRMRGVQRGVEAAAEYHRWRWHDLGMRAELTQQSSLSNGPTVAVEFDTVGTIGTGLPVHHWAMYCFDVLDGVVVGFREYNGDEIVDQR